MSAATSCEKWGCFFLLTAGMTPTRLRLAFSTSFVLLFCSVSYLYHTYRSPIYHPLADKGDAGLFFPNDPVPRFNFKSLAKYPAQNLNEPSKFTFATFYCSRNPSMLGPYFESTQSIIWRILWSDFRTSKYPIVVFVCPFIPEENRQILRGQGAVVKEIELLDDIVPDKEISTKRWIDVLSKLNLWKEVEWKRIMFLDSDAFPVRNIDDIFDMVPEQKCDRDSLGPEDAWIVEGGQRGDDMCNYVYAGVSQFYDENINAGMLLLKPNLDMHAKLIRAARSTGDYKPSDLEQGVLRSKNAFAANGPFPVKRLPIIWNGLPEEIVAHIGSEPKEGPFRILHTKMWNRFWGGATNLTYLNDMWDLNWMQMCRFYDSEEEFVEARKAGRFGTPMERYIAARKKWDEARKGDGSAR